MKKKNGILSALLVVVVALVLAVGQATGILPERGEASQALPTEATQQAQWSEASLALPTEAARQAKRSNAPRATPTVAPRADDEEQGPIIEPQAIADYLFEHGELPDNFITKREAQDLGWDSRRNYVSDVAPGKSIGGDTFGNYEGLLPKAKGRKYHECDCNYTTGPRGAERIVYSTDGLVFYTADHYETFVAMEPSGN